MPISDAAVRRVMTVLPALAAACSPSGPANRTLAAVEAGQRSEADEDGMVLCGVGKAALARTCSVEESMTARGLVLTLRRPDGSFRRLLATRDGRGLIAADGAEPARVSVVGPDVIEVTLGDQRYRLPATVKR